MTSWYPEKLLIMDHERKVKLLRVKFEKKERKRKQNHKFNYEYIPGKRKYILYVHVDLNGYRLEQGNCH